MIASYMYRLSAGRCSHLLTGEANRTASIVQSPLILMTIQQYTLRSYIVQGRGSVHFEPLNTKYALMVEYRDINFLYQYQKGHVFLW